MGESRCAAQEGTELHFLWLAQFRPSPGITRWLTIANSDSLPSHGIADSILQHGCRKLIASTEPLPNREGMIRRQLRVLLLEDSAADAELIERELEQRGLRITAQRVDTASAYEGALRDFNPHVIVCDHGVPGLDTEGALRSAKSIRPAVPVIIVSGSLDVRSIVSAMRAGAEDVVLKMDLAPLVPAIEAGLAARARLSQLSPRQLEVLRLVAEGYTTPAIAEQLSLSTKTVESHRGEIMKRLGIHDLARLVRYAVRLGMVSTDA